MNFYYNYIVRKETPMLSKRIQNISESQTLAINSLCQELKSKGEMVYNFSIGEPDFQPPIILKEELGKAFDAGYTKYTNPIGLTEARKKCAQFFSTLNNMHFKSEEIALTSGGKQALYVTLQVLIDPQDEIIIIKPYWVSYVEQIKMAGGTPVFVNTDSSLQIDVEEIKKAITPKTKAIIINSPCNPTGAVFKKEKIIELAKLLENKNIYIITDDVYQSLVFEGEFYQIASYSEKIREKTIIIQSFSKSLSMTGLRLGIIIAHIDIIKAIGAFQGHASGNPTSLIQMAVINILGKTEDYQKKYVHLFNERRKLVQRLLGEIKEITFVKPEGAFYFFIDIRKIENDSKKFTKKLLEEKHIALVPGIAFGQEGFARISFASSKEDLIKGMALLKEFCEKYN